MSSNSKSSRATRRRSLSCANLRCDSLSSDSSDSDSDSDSDEDDTAELLRELEKIKRERAEEKARIEALAAEADQVDREHEIATGNPLLNLAAALGQSSGESEAGTSSSFKVGRRWDDGECGKRLSEVTKADVRASTSQMLSSRTRRQARRTRTKRRSLSTTCSGPSSIVRIHDHPCSLVLLLTDASILPSTSRQVHGQVSTQSLSTALSLSLRYGLTSVFISRFIK